MQYDRMRIFDIYWHIININIIYPYIFLYIYIQQIFLSRTHLVYTHTCKYRYTYVKQAYTTYKIQDTRVHSSP